MNKNEASPLLSNMARQGGGLISNIRKYSATIHDKKGLPSLPPTAVAEG